MNVRAESPKSRKNVKAKVERLKANTEGFREKWKGKSKEEHGFGEIISDL